MLLFHELFFFFKELILQNIIGAVDTELSKPMKILGPGLVDMP